MHSGLPLKLGALLAAVIAVLVLSAAVLAAGKAGDSGPSSNYTGPPQADLGPVQPVQGSNIPAWADSGPAASRPAGNNRLDDSLTERTLAWHERFCRASDGSTWPWPGSPCSL